MTTELNRRKRPWRALLLALAILTSSLLAARWVQARVGARVDQQVLHLHRAFDELLQQARLDPPRTADTRGGTLVVHFNGIQIRAQTRRFKATKQELHALFAVLRSQCLAPLSSTGLSQKATWGAPLVENSNAKESYLYCLRPHAPVTLANLGSLAQQFAASLDVAQLGQVRGLYARSHHNEHQLLMVQLEGAVDLDRAFSTTGDAPGHDFADLPRPPGRRSASVSLNGAPELNVYQLAVDAGFTLPHYAEQLTRRGVDVLAPSRASAGPVHAVVARTPHNTYVVVLHPRSVTRQQTRLSITRVPE